MSQEALEQLKDEGTRQQVIVAGGIAGLVSRFCIAPLDVVKIRLQLQPHSLSDPLSCDGIKGPIYKGAFSTLRKIAREEGIRALWKGNIPAEALYVCYSGAQFTTYRAVTQLQGELPLHVPDSAESFVSGATAGAVATMLTYPLDLLRTRWAAQGQIRIYGSLLASVRDIGTHEGPRGYFRGLTAALMQIVPYMGLFFTTYEMVHIPLTRLNLPFGGADATSGVVASIIAKTAVFPLDLIRKRLQVQGPTLAKYVHSNIPVYKGIFTGLYMILRKEGIRGCYRGLTVSLLKAAPASAVTMWTYERALHALRSADRSDEMWQGYNGYEDALDDYDLDDDDWSDWQKTPAKNKSMNKPTQPEKHQYPARLPPH